MQGRVNVFFLDMLRFKKVIGGIRLRKKKYFVSKDVTFIENTFFFKQNPNKGEMSLDPIKDSNLTGYDIKK